MAEFTKYTSGFSVGGENIGIEAAKVQWNAISTLTADSAATTTSGIMTPDQIQSLVNDKIAGVYTVKGSKAATGVAALTDMVKGDVWNITESGTIGTETVYVGDNVVYDGTAWDKLAASVSLEGYATTAWVNSESQPYTALTATSANWNTAYDEITGAVVVSADMTDDNSAKIAQVGAITGYVESKIAEEISETVEITDTIEGAATSAIPNVGAITGYDAKNVTSAFGTVIVNAGTEGATDSQYEASAKNDKIKFVGGTNISLAAAADANGNPTITINNTYEAAATPSITGGNGITAALVPASEGVTEHYEVSGVDATTAVAGVTKAAYYEESTGLIHLF